MSRDERRGACALCHAVAAVVVAGALAADAAQVAGFYSESTSTLESKRIGTVTRRHRTWLTEDRLRFDDEAASPPETVARLLPTHAEGRLGCDALTTIVRLDTGEVLIANRARRTFIRQSIRNLGSVIAELADAMTRYVASRVVRTRLTRTIGGSPCHQCRIDLARVPCAVWVQDDSRELFDALRAWARGASRRMGSARAPLVLAFGGLGGLPREVTVGDPKTLALTWTVERYATDAVPNRIFDLPASFREDASVPAMSYVLLEHVYLVGETTASWYAKSPEQRDRSLMPTGLAITTPSLLNDFYKGRKGAERYGIYRWGKPLAFCMAPELWRYPLSGRSISFVILIGTCLRGGGLRYYPPLEMLKLPAN